MRSAAGRSFMDSSALEVVSEEADIPCVHARHHRPHSGREERSIIFPSLLGAVDVRKRTMNAKAITYLGEVGIQGFVVPYEIDQ